MRNAILSIISDVRMAWNWTCNIFDTPIVILAYHRVADLEHDPQQLAVSPARFREQIQFLKDNFPIIRLESDSLSAKEPSVIVTFDDGYADNESLALPILEEIGVPATFFVTSGYVDSNREFWWDDLDRVILGDFSFPESFSLVDDFYSASWPTATHNDRIRLYEDMNVLMKKIDHMSRLSWFEQLYRWAQVGEKGRIENKTLTVEGLRRLALSPCATVGAHTVTHISLASLPVKEQRKEIATVKQHLESWLSKEVNLISYPFGGKRDYTTETITVVKNHNFVRACSNFPGQVHSWTNPYQLPRNLVRNWSVNSFAQKMNGFWIK